jgi:glycosyltransferase involved in cell wall biosynthesis
MTKPPFLSIVIPAWNEEQCIWNSLDTVTAYLDKQEYAAEIVVVDDGSTDKTRAMIKSFIGEYEGQTPVRLIENDHFGKGYAVRTGVLDSHGKYVLFADADLATPVYEIGKMVGALEAGCDIAIGTRVGVGAERVDEPLLRRVMARGFNLLVRLLSGLHFHDTQAGFKGFRHEVAQDLFRQVRLYGAEAKEVTGSALTAFDVEVLYLASRAGHRIEEIPVKWKYGPTIAPRVSDSVRMFLDIVKIRWMAMQGLYD